MPRPSRDHQLDVTSEPLCEEAVVHVEDVRRARADLPSPGALAKMADLFAALSDPTRLRIIASLEHGRLCVCDIAAAVGLSMSAASHQLRLLRQRGLVRVEREGRMAYYSLDDDHVMALYRQAATHIEHVDQS